MVDSGLMNSIRLIEFIKQLIKDCPAKIFLILENMKVYHSILVKEWLGTEEEKELIELFFLPSYSADRNPDEWLNCDLAQGMSSKPLSGTDEKLSDKVVGHMTTLQ